MTHDLLASLEHAIETLQRLDATLQEEWSLLQSRDAEKLLSLQKAKEQLLKALESLPFLNRGHLDDLIEKAPLDRQPQLQSARQTLIEQLRRCKDQHHVNGMLIHKHMQSISRIQNILHGKNQDLGLYDCST